MVFRMKWPTQYGAITQRFGANVERYQKYGLPGHEGVDIQAPAGTEIYCAADGIVSDVYLDGFSDPLHKPYGHQVRIQHVNGYESIYAHLSEVCVVRGQVLKAHQLVGLAGNTGNSLGSHLHLGLKKQGATGMGETEFPHDLIDPQPFLDAFKGEGAFIPVPPDEAAFQVQVHSPELGYLNLRVSPYVGAALISRLDDGAMLDVLEDKGWAWFKVGQERQWLWVRTRQGQVGYVAAWYLLAIEDAPQEIPENVIWLEVDSPEVDLKLRKGPGTHYEHVSELAHGTILKAREGQQEVYIKVGSHGQWLYVQTPVGLMGYVAAWYVKLPTEAEQPIIPEPPSSEPTEYVVVESPDEGLRLRNGPTVEHSRIWWIPHKTVLHSLEDASDTGNKVGNLDAWIKVRTPSLWEGYVAAWYTRHPELDDQRVPISSSQVKAGLSPSLYGVHTVSVADDPQFRAQIQEFFGHTHKGWLVFTEIIGHNPNRIQAVPEISRRLKYWADLGYGIIIRLNNSYEPDGTLPISQHYDAFAATCANWVAAFLNQPTIFDKPYTWTIQIGNEQNNPREHPGGLDHPREHITAELFAEAFNKVYNAIHDVANGNVVICPGAIDPYNYMPMHKLGGERWRPLDYYSQMLEKIDNLDGIILHAYTHGPDPVNVTDLKRFGDGTGPLWDHYYHFRTFRLFMERIPAKWRDVPVYIAEMNHIHLAGEETKLGWADQNVGWVQEIYREIDRWNQTPYAQQIRGAMLYRWSYDEWSFENKPLVRQDFQQALAENHTWRGDPENQAFSYAVRTAQHPHDSSERNLLTPEDLTRLWGIGDKTQTALYAAGIQTYEQLVRLNPRQLQVVLEEVDLHPRYIHTWSDQARLALDGKWHELDKFILSLPQLLDQKDHSTRFSAATKPVSQIHGKRGKPLTDSELRHILRDAVSRGLRHLDLSYAGITSLPSEIGRLTTLATLDLSGNELLSLPPELGKLTKLRQLELRHNQLTALPPEIGNSTRLMVLDVQDNQLIELPEAIRKLQHLRTLDLRENMFSQFPVPVLSLDGLEELHLWRNPLTTLPDEIGTMRGLRLLNIGGCDLARLPQGLFALTNLEQLVVDHTKVEYIPLGIGNLRKLWNLELGNNRIDVIPSEVGALQNLLRLDLQNNLLSTLPSSIGNLRNLQRLDLHNNRLDALPAALKDLTALQVLDIANNPLPVPPEILTRMREPGALIEYFVQHLSGDRMPLNEAKMVLVGQGSVGKTSLVNRLMHDSFNPIEPKTEGIAINQWQINVNATDIVLNVWDFGGQEIMHATHQFFLTRRTLYLLVLDSRQSEIENRLEYWLKIIQSYGGDSPVIVVSNKTDQHHLELDVRSLKVKYPQIKSLIETSCQVSTGIGKLRAHIAREVSRMPHVRDELLSSWFDVKRELESEDHDYIPYESYQETCAQHGIVDEQSQRTLLSFLNDLGVVLNFQDDPRLTDTNILNPEWVTRGVYRILNNNEVIANNGILKRSDLMAILDPKAYPRHKHQFILDMMRKFELCFSFEDYDDDRFLIPDLLRKEAPGVGEWSQTLAFQYQYNVLPGSVITRFIVRTHSYLEESLCWRQGVVISDQLNQALIRADLEDRRIYVWVKGPERTRRVLLSIIRSQFDFIHKTIPGIQVAERVPLPDHPDVSVDYCYLLDLEAMGEKRFVPSGLRQFVEVRPLLNGVDLESTLQDNVRLRQILVERYNLEEMKTLCYDVGVPFTELGTESKVGIAREIVAYLERRRRLSDLVRVGKQQRPDIQWNAFEGSFD